MQNKSMIARLAAIKDWRQSKFIRACESGVRSPREAVAIPREVAEKAKIIYRPLA